jgi:NAD(P)-dependent dehydrogenase (short-subunit alcohol dehydrogenase family)
MQRVKDKIALVTGGANGIGKAIAKALLKEGAQVAVTDIDAENGKKIAQEISSNGAVKFYQQDVTREEQWKKVLEKVQSDLGSVDILLNNAGIYIIAPVAETSMEQFDKLMAVNVKGVFLGMKYLAPHMAQNGGGSIINMSSVAGLKGLAGHALYGASKGAVRIMNKDVAAEYAQQKVRVNSIHPGYIDTGMADYGAEITGSSKEELGKMHPIGHMGQPEDVAHAVVFLASEESKFMTGSELTIDGGLDNCIIM